MAAAMCAHADVVLALMCRGADPNRADEGGETALHLAAEYAGDRGGDSPRGGCREIVEILAKRADADARDARGFAPLLTACWNGNDAAVETLIRTYTPRRLNLDASTDAGRSPLHAACWRGGFQRAAALLDAGADLDARDADGRAALWAAARAGDERCVRLCLESGAGRARLRRSRPGGRRFTPPPSPTTWRVVSPRSSRTARTRDRTIATATRRSTSSWTPTTRAWTKRGS